MEVVLLAACCVGAFEASVLWQDEYLPYIPSVVAAVGDAVYLGRVDDFDDREIVVVDVSDPAAPRRVWVPMGFAGEMQVSGSLLYVGNAGLTIYDVSNPLYPKVVTQDYLSGQIITSLKVVRTTVYLVTEGAYYVHVVDAADPTAPTVICSYDMGDLGQLFGYSLAVVGPSVYVGVYDGNSTGHGVLVLQPHPTTCSYVAMHGTDSLVTSMVVSDGLLYMGTTSSVEIVEAEDFTPVGEYTLPDANFLSCIVLSGSLLYVASSSDEGTLRILNVSDPSSPSLVAAHSAPISYSAAFDLVGTTLFELRGGTPVLEVIDVSTPEAPKVIGGFGASQPALSTHATDTLAVVCYKENFRDPDSFMRLYDVSNPSAPTQLSDVHLNPPNKAFIHGTHVYVATDDGLTIVDITNPSAPFVASNTSSNGRHFLDVKVEGETAYVAGFGSGLYIYNVSNPSAPKQVGYLEARASFPRVVVAGTVAYVSTDTGLLTVDVSSPANPKLLGTYVASIDDVCVQGTVTYLVSYERLLIVDVSDPTDPTLLGECQTPSSAFISNSVSVVEDIAYLEDHDTGLHIFDVSNATNPVLLDVVELGGKNGLRTSVHAVGTTVFAIDERLSIVGIYTPTATLSTETVTQTATDSMTATGTPAHTATATLRTLTATGTLTHTTTDSMTDTGTQTATGTLTHTATDSVTATVTPTRTGSETVTATGGVGGTGSSGVPFWVWVLVAVGVLGVCGVAGVVVVRRRSSKKTSTVQTTLFEGPGCGDDAGDTWGFVEGGELQDFELEPSLPFGVAVAS